MRIDSIVCLLTKRTLTAREMSRPAQHREAEGLTVATRIASTQPDVGDAHLTFCSHDPLYAAGVSAGTHSRVCSSLRFFHREISLHTSKITYRYMSTTQFVR